MANLTKEQLGAMPSIPDEGGLRWGSGCRNPPPSYEDSAAGSKRANTVHATVLPQQLDPILMGEDVAARLNVKKDWVWDHSSRRLPYLPVIRLSDGTLRYRASQIEEFINERERASVLHRKRR